MKITVTKVIRELQENYGWSGIKADDIFLLKGIVSDTLSIIDNQLKRDKGISIK